MLCCLIGATLRVIMAEIPGGHLSPYRALDGTRAYNPTAGVERPAKPKPSANAVSLEAVVKVLTALKYHHQPSLAECHRASYGR